MTDPNYKQDLPVLNTQAQSQAGHGCLDRAVAELREVERLLRTVGLVPMAERISYAIDHVKHGAKMIRAAQDQDLSDRVQQARETGGLLLEATLAGFGMKGDK